MLTRLGLWREGPLSCPYQELEANSGACAPASTWPRWPPWKRRSPVRGPLPAPVSQTASFDCARDDGPSAESLAARFAAKEAVVKVLRPGGRQLDGAPSRSVASGRLVLFGAGGEAARRAQHAGLDDLAVALSHEGDIAVALVVALAGAPEASRNRRELDGQMIRQVLADYGRLPSTR